MTRRLIDPTGPIGYQAVEFLDIPALGTTRVETPTWPPSMANLDHADPSPVELTARSGTQSGL